VAVRGADPLNGLGVFGKRLETEKVYLNGVNDFVKNLLFRDEVGVEASVGGLRFVADISDTGPQESISLKDGAGAIDQLLA
jgi:hypothetical protein